MTAGAVRVGPGMSDRSGRPAGFGRRLAALCYDALLLAALLVAGTFVVLPFTGGAAITPAAAGPWEHAYRAWLLLLAAGYFCIPWTRRGQTLGMMTWKIRLERESGGLPRWSDALARFALGAVLTIAALSGAWLLRGAAAPGRAGLSIVLLLPAVANYLFMLADARSRTLLDMASRCRVLRLH